MRKPTIAEVKSEIMTAITLHDREILDRIKNTETMFSDVVHELFPLGYDKVISKGIENAWKKSEAKGLANAN
jgi:hypothetical protein|tara:strand:- start:156 stop:371 length:216 start_codon:yes stop_codon:yes gene_type:complete